ncbi:hypothetical protein COU76_03495 [Candidatus Peregrinibacteria bacterium CG10_big_fil_rev_8_21_14_0_10_49_10]|nr:MAG: hypothetical protein COU76_03495 [Candidatus Peregrinibacteria bacterium CG10_big_fil_rev_8_21_14_0_10_49_10]
MSFVHLLVILSVFVSIGGSTAYIRDTFKGKTKPNRISWTMWAVAPLIGTGAALSSGADPWATVKIFTAGFLPLVILLFSFLNPKSYWRLTLFDLLCGFCSVLAMLLWLVVDKPTYAILLAATGDGFAGLPTLRKAWTHPETETGITYIMGLISVLIILPSIPQWDIPNASFQVYLIGINSALIFAVYRKKMFHVQSV